MSGSDTALAAAPQRTHRSAFRGDIEGLRTVAIGLVLVYHAGITFVPGGFVGVDVFFVISGFLITGILVRELESSGRVSLARFWARRARRLLPATGLVLAATALGVWLLMPATSWRTFGGDIAGAAFYVVNWVFANRSVDYLAEGVDPSPALHFWSLAVEEQFYVLWPLLLCVVALVLRRWRSTPTRPAMAAVLVAIAVPSFLWSVNMTASGNPAAFFVTTTRLWELALGAAVALGATLWPRIPARLANVLGWVGLAAIGVAALAFDSSTSWPGSAALLPTLGTAAVIVAGYHAGGPVPLLSLRPMVWVGGLSYSLYLWHWPILVLGAAVLGELGQKTGLLLVAASFVPAWLGHKFVENPLRFHPALARSNALSLAVGLNFTLVGGLVGVLVMTAAAPAASSADGADVPGARVVKESELEPADADRYWNAKTSPRIVPDPLLATEDVPEVYADGCQVGSAHDEIITCDYGDPDGDVHVVMVGDSKIVQWQSALDAIAQDEGWRLTTLARSACLFAEPVADPGDDPSRIACAEWNPDALDHLLEVRPDVVVASNGGQDEPGRADRVIRYWEQLIDAGIHVVPLLDNPAPHGIGQVYECVAENRDDLSSCSFDAAAGRELSAEATQRKAASALGVTSLVDMNPFICPGTRCPAVLGEALVYRQGSHLTKTIVDTAKQHLAAQLVPIVENRHSS